MKKHITALIVGACLMPNSPAFEDCSVIEDTRGSYTDARACADRVVEMSDAIKAIDKRYVILTGRCEPVENSQHRFPMT